MKSIGEKEGFFADFGSKMGKMTQKWPKIG